MKKTILSLFTFFSIAAFTLFADGKRLPYELQKEVAGCDTVYTLPDKKVEFPEGTSAMFNFFKKNLAQSEELTNISATRRLILKLLVDSQGKIVQSSILTSLSPEYDKEALRVVSIFPELIPAKVKGRNVCSYLLIPLIYK